MKVLITLRTRLVLLVIAAIVPIFGFSVANAVMKINEDIRQATKNLEFTASQVASTQEQVADSAHQLLISIAKAPALVQTGLPECHDYFKSLNDELVPYTNIGLIGSDGYFLCHSLDKMPGDFAGDRQCRHGRVWLFA